jgi:periplasmic protein TonB
MKLDTDSAGPGKHHGIGSTDGGTMGDGDSNGAGVENDADSYANVLSLPVCNYCPNPDYTEAARKAKLQGAVSVQVLIGADGSPKRIRILKGLGMGLDEQTVATVRSWRFTPARDPQHRPISVWVTIEAAFRLY